MFFCQSIGAEKNATKNVHICSMCIQINKVSKQELPSIVAEKNVTKNVHICSSSIVAEKNVTKNVHIGSMCSC